MKKKKFILGMIISMAVMYPQNLMADNSEEQVISDFSDGILYEDTEAETGLFSSGDTYADKDVMLDDKEKTADEVQLYGSTDDYAQNQIELNQYYNASELIDSWGYMLRLNIPKDGRIKIKVIDCNTKVFDTIFYLPDTSDTFTARYWKEVGIDSVDSGWITVNSGIYIPKFHTRGDINREARLIVEYQGEDEYNGEKENNDTYDNANVIEPNIVYEGNYSKNKDIDMYKFQMQKSGLAVINIKENDDPGYASIYEEDVKGNIYDIKRIMNSGRLRLAPGNYFIKVSPNLFSDDSEYSLNVNVTYEEPEVFEQEKNNVRSQANVKQANTWYTGNLNTKEDIDYFRFDIEKRSYLALEFKVPRQLTPGIIGITLYDSQMKMLQSQKNTANPYFITEEKVYPAGTYYVRVEGGDFNKDYSFNLNQREVASKKNIADLSFSKIPSMQYTGKNITPLPVIKDGKNVLENGKDYTLSYNKNKNIGSAGIKITGIGNYTGTKIIKFNIVPKKVSLNAVKQSGNGKLKISWTKSSGAQGYEIYRYIKPNGTYRKVKSISNVNTLNYTDSGLKNGTKYYYKIRAYKKVSGKTYYSAYSNIRYSTTTNAAPKIEGTYTFNSSNYGTVTLTIYKSGSTYYVRAYGRGGKMNTTEVLYKYGNGYKAFYDHKGGDVFISVSNVTSSGIKVNFPRISEFNGTYKRQ